MNYWNSIKNYLLILSISLWCCNACAESPPPPSAANCAGFNSLISMAQSDDIFNLSADEFTVKYKDLFTVTSDEKTSMGKITIRELSFKPTSGNWLLQAQANYGNASKPGSAKLQFSRIEFSIQPSCMKNRKDLNDFLTQHFGKPSAENLSTTSQEPSSWEWYKENPKTGVDSWSRQFIASPDEVQLILEIPDPNEGG